MMHRLNEPLWAYVGACIERGEPEEAIATLTPLVEKSPGEAMLRRGLVLALMEAGHHRDALPHLEWLYAQPDGKDPITCHRYALALHFVGEFRRCLDVCNEGLAHYPQFSQLLALRGGTWQVFGEFENMMDDCQKAAALDANDLHVQYALALRELMVSDLTKGFDGYSERIFEKDEEPIPFFDIPSWEGESLTNKTLLLIWEQGVGDMIMFASFIPLLRQLGGRLIVTVPEKLYRLFTRSFPECEVLVVRDSTMEQQLAERADYAVLMGDLIELCLADYRPVAHPPYLKADLERRDTLRQKYLEHSPGTKRLVGIAWYTTNAETGIVRTIPLAQWRPLFSVPGIQYVCLQYNPPAELPSALLHDPEIDAFNDLEALAAQVAAMDNVITIQNATAHLAGALGVPTTLLLSSASDWRWGIRESKGAWYQSVTILRQQEPLVWEPVMQDVARALRTLMAKK